VQICNIRCFNVLCSARKLCLSIMSIVCIIVSAFNASFYVLMQYMTVVGFRPTTSANMSRHSAPSIMDTLRITTPTLQPPNKFILPHQKKYVSLHSLSRVRKQYARKALQYCPIIEIGKISIRGTCINAFACTRMLFVSAYRQA